MKNQVFVKCTLVLLSTTFASSGAWAQARAAGGGGSSTTASPSTTATAATPAAVPVTDPNMRDQVNQTATQQGSASAVGTVVSGGLGAWSVYAASQHNWPLAAALGAASLAANSAAKHNSAMSAGNQNFACQVTAGGCAGSSTSDSSSTKTTDGTNGNGGSSGGMDSSSGGAAALQSLVKQGFKVDPKSGTVTTPDGHSFGPSALASPSAAAAAGLSAADFGKLKDISKKLEAEAKAKSADGLLSDSDFGGSAKSGAVSGDSTLLPNGPRGGPGAGGAFGINRDPAQIAGLQTNLNGEPIGVSSDSIFGIIDRRYQWHKDQGSFLAP